MVFQATGMLPAQCHLTYSEVAKLCCIEGALSSSKHEAEKRAIEEAEAKRKK